MTGSDLFVMDAREGKWVVPGTVGSTPSRERAIIARRCSRSVSKTWLSFLVHLGLASSVTGIFLEGNEERLRVGLGLLYTSAVRFINSPVLKLRLKGIS